MPNSWRVVRMDLITGRDDLVGPLRQAVRREARPVVTAVRAAWLSVEVSSTRGGTARPVRSTALRRRTAAATGVEFTPSGARISVNAEQIDPVYGRSLMWYLNASGRRPWRHPIFGRRATSRDWTVQRGQQVFFSTVAAHEPAFRAAAELAMEEVARQY